MPKIIGYILITLAAVQSCIVLHKVLTYFVEHGATSTEITTVFLSIIGTILIWVFTILYIKK